MLARLTVHFPFQPTRSFVVRGDAAVIGRDPGCDIVLEDDRVSRRHARLAFAEGAWRLADLESTNGTSLGGAPLDTRNLWPEPGPQPNPKDAVERKLQLAVCAGRISLIDAQERIASDWTTATRGLG